MTVQRQVVNTCIKQQRIVHLNIVQYLDVGFDAPVIDEQQRDGQLVGKTAYIVSELVGGETATPAESNPCHRCPLLSCIGG